MYFYVLFLFVYYLLSFTTYDFLNYSINFEKTHTNSSSTMQPPILVLDNGGNTINAGVVSNGGTFE